MAVGVLVEYELGVKNRLIYLKDVAKAGLFNLILRGMTASYMLTYGTA